VRSYNTVNEIVSEIQQLHRNVTGRSELAALERDIIQSAIIDAYQFVLLEYGVARFRFDEIEIEMTTVAAQNYVDLDEFVYGLKGGSVRIPDERNSLGIIDEAKIFLVDPGADSDGIPYAYAYGSSGDPNILRVIFYPIPDAVYTIKAKAYKYPENEITEFPAELMSAIKYKSKSLAFLGLGLSQLQPGFERAYEQIVAKVKDGYDGDEAKHIQKREFDIPRRSIEGRIPVQ
jgi:hypothetical protein